MNMADSAGWVSRFESRVRTGIGRVAGPRAAVRLRADEITWKCSQRTVWVATHSTEFLGTVEEQDGTYIANDTQRGTYNTYRTLAEAMQAFEVRDDGDSFPAAG
jgi:hypothetical protein